MLLTSNSFHAFYAFKGNCGPSMPDARRMFDSGFVGAYRLPGDAIVRIAHRIQQAYIHSAEHWQQRRHEKTGSLLASRCRNDEDVRRA